MRRFAAILIALIAGFMLDGAVVASVGQGRAVSSANNAPHKPELSAEMLVQIDCARTYNSDLKLPSVPSVTAPQHVEQTLRNDYGGERRSVCFSVVRAAGAGRVYLSTKPLSRLFVGGAPSDFAIRMLCRLII